ncbi:MAG: T9SS type A sorting domain-containing protein [Melioribacteraceae bacterium]|nr:T9SS type A sorting domain-containing protein [Melioribacteraceae bacterium]MCF8353393.1 T9SS type A sorting domain-containing protein [Melioribacteraceae bacterium]MCF8393028.1 T9SS type A sorting domain-containing protein [Melioribacteraceae bacterium]MCF8419119.1 T9SS type A sorting domain-containing protein [Melioribacteraceae bacterium]
MLVADDSNIGTRVELEQGNNDYHNYWDASLELEPIRIKQGDTFEELIGIQYFSFSNYKLVPRTNDDFVGHVTDVKDEALTAEKYSLAQNYPNPFNPTTNIQFSIPESGLVTLKIYDVLGQEVMNLINQEMNRGVHRIKVDASQLSSGIYFYRLDTGNFTSTKKMLLLK